jgi:hypothetical protein
MAVTSYVYVFVPDYARAQRETSAMPLRFGNGNMSILVVVKLFIAFSYGIQLWLQQHKKEDHRHVLFNFLHLTYVYLDIVPLSPPLTLASVVGLLCRGNSIVSPTLTPPN